MRKKISLKEARKRIIKTCPKCKVEKLVGNFNKNRSNNDGLQSQCRVCSRASNRKYQKVRRVDVLKNQRRINKKRMLLDFGLTLQDYDRIVEDQRGLCAICGLPEKVVQRGTIRSLAVDHNHTTGKVRGLLCGSCNTSLGKLKVDSFGTLNLEKAIEYLNRSQG